MTNTTQDLSLILLNFHSATAAVTPLPSLELMIDQIHVNRQTCRQAFDDRNQTPAMRLSGCSETKHG
jgi:hypothetical protein